jgi:hypothetical protein
MEPLTFTQFNHSDTLELATRYVTSRYDDPNGAALSFNQTTDPNGILASMRNSKYFHGDDNKVLFFARRHDKGGIPR